MRALCVLHTLQLLLNFQGLKKYHVRNDIFRYQEERYPDEVSDETGDATNGKKQPKVLVNIFKALLKLFAYVMLHFIVQQCI